MIEIVRLRELTLREPLQPGRPSFLSAASGLVRAGELLYVIADDENHLAVFNESDSAHGEVLRLFEGELPSEKGARKRSKPDLEALALLPAHFHSPHGALLAIPSGSKPQRRTGALIPLGSKGEIHGSPSLIDFTLVYDLLEKRCGALNIEAGLVFDSHLHLFNRGNKKDRTSSMVSVRLDAVLNADRNGTPLRKVDLVGVYPLDLGELNGVALTPTDAALLESGQIVFTAVAEDTDNSYADGACHGSAIGLLDVGGKVSSLETVNTTRKLEGVTARMRGDRVELLLVNDEDSDSAASELQRAYLPS